MDRGQQFGDFLAERGFSPQEQNTAENNSLAIDLNHAEFHSATSKAHQKLTEAFGGSGPEIEADGSAWLEMNRHYKTAERLADEHKSLTGQELRVWDKDDNFSCSHCGGSLELRRGDNGIGSEWS